MFFGICGHEGLDRGSRAGHDGAVIRVLAALTVALVAGCTGTGPPSCDQAALMAIAETLEREAASPGAETRAIAGLGVACPRLDPGSVHAMRAAHVHERLESLAIYDGLYAARRPACADPDGWVRDVPAAPASLRQQIVFDRCGFARLGVLDGGEQLLGDDTDVLFVLATLQRDGVDRALLRRLGRALMISVAPLPVAGRRCAAMPDYDGCARLLRVAEVAPAPASGSRDGLRVGPRLLLSPTAMSWNGETIASLDRGAFRPADVEEHRVVPLALAVAAWTANPHDGELSLVLAPDRGLAFGAVVDALYTATRGGVTELALVGRDDFQLVTIPLSSPRAWLPSADDSAYQPEWPVVKIDESTVAVTLLPGETTRLPADSSAALTALAARARVATFNGEFHVRATRATRVDTVIAVLDALRGPECPRDDVGAGCLLSRPIVDQEPPLE
jgi:biopolymer transport protein ExbD